MNLTRDEIDEIAKEVAERVLSQSNRLVVDPTRMACTPRLKEIANIIESKWLAEETLAAIDYRGLADDLEEAGLNVRPALLSISNDELAHYTTLAAIVHSIKKGCQG